MKITQIPKTKIIYRSRIGAYGIENKKFMENFKQWLKDNNLFTNDSVVLAIPRDNPQTTDQQKCRYDVALVVESFEEVGQLSINIGILESGKYAVFTVEHTEKAIAKAMQHLLTEIASKGYSFNTQLPIIERYAVKRIENNKCELCIPIL